MLYSINNNNNNNGIHVLNPGLTTNSLGSATNTSAGISGSFTYLTDRFVAGVGQDITLGSLDMTQGTVWTAATGIRSNLRTYNFDGSSAEYATFTSKMPADYSQRPVDIVLNWTANEPGTTVWSAQIDPYGTGIVDGNDFGNASYGSGTIAASGEIVSTAISMSSANMKGLQRNEVYSLKVYRWPTSGADNITTDASLFYLDIRENYLV